MAGTWKSENILGRLDTGFATIAPYGPAVGADTQQLVEQKKADLISGQLQPFRGPIVDSEGKLRIREGEVVSPDDLLATTDWVVEGVSGQIK